MELGDMKRLLLGIMLCMVGQTQAVKELLGGYEAWMQSSRRAENVINLLQLDMIPEELLGNVAFASDSLRRTVQISVKNSDPDLANDVATAWGNLLIQKQQELNDQNRQEDRITIEFQDNPKYALDRKADIQLPDAEQPTLRLATDGKRVVISVVDPFGGLRRHHVFAGLARGLKGGEMDQSHGGAGLGMVVCHNSTVAMFYDVVTGKKTVAVRNAPASQPATLAAVDPDKMERLRTGITEFDFVLGGGLVPGSLVLVGGEPGIGKSTILMQLAEKLGKTLYVYHV